MYGSDLSGSKGYNITNAGEDQGNTTMRHAQNKIFVYLNNNIYKGYFIYRTDDANYYVHSCPNYFDGDVSLAYNKADDKLWFYPNGVVPSGDPSTANGWTDVTNELGS